MFICLICPNTFYCEQCFKFDTHEHPCLYSYNIDENYEELKFLPNSFNTLKMKYNVKKDFYDPTIMPIYSC